jgi:hypothetical protein
MLQRFAITDLAATPWKNGGGSTREVVCQPPGAGMDAFDWRVSIASIAQSGPFSLFPGIDRTILLLDGDGVHLQSGHGIDHRLTTPLEPFAFSGDLALDCTLLGGESTDFNVMTRRGVARAAVQVHRTHATLESSSGGVLLALHGGWTLSNGRETLELAPGQGAWWHGATAWHGAAATAQARLVSVCIAPTGS